MKKGIKSILYLLASCLLGATAYLVSESLYLFLGVTLMFFLSFLFFIHPWLSYRFTRDKKQKECYQFISSFIVNYSITSSLERSFDSATAECEGEFREIVKTMGKNDIRSRIFYLDRYFENDSYRMFLSLFTLYENQGGELLNISKGLLDELTRIEENRSAIGKESKRNLIEFSSTWAMAVLLLCFLRFGLANFYQLMVHSSLFLIGVAFFFVFLCFSICLYFYFYCSKPPSHKGKNP